MIAQPDTVHWLVELMREGIFLALLIAAPVVLAAVVAGFVVSVLQAATQITEPTLSFAPKVAAAIVALVAAGPWIVEQALEFTRVVLEHIPRLGRG